VCSQIINPDARGVETLRLTPTIRRAGPNAGHLTPRERARFKRMRGTPLDAAEALDLGGLAYARSLHTQAAVDRALDQRFERTRELALLDSSVANSLADTTDRAIPRRENPPNEKLRDRPRGSCARPIVGRDQTGRYVISWRPCGKWSCPSCSADLVTECARPVLQRARAGGAIFMSTIANTSTAKKSASAKARRDGGEYLAVPLGDEIALYSTIAITP
jgi:hypothetical protein